MPKINVYLPDELAEAVRDTGVPVSPICQRALEHAVRRITAIRQTVLTDLTEDDVAELVPHFTGRAGIALTLAVGQARQTGATHVGTGPLLGGMLAEGGNLALQILAAIDIDPAQVRVGLEASTATEPGADQDGLHFSTAAATALELTVGEATGLGHNYVGCEHMLIGLAAEPDGVAGEVLRGLGADARTVRRAVTAALAGYAHLQSNNSAPSAVGSLRTAVRAELAPLVRRIERLESQLTT
jgi:ATP-dependent Clp protease ATP-binding subunit ClpA